MSRANLIEVIAKQQNCTKKEADQIIKSFTEGVTGTLKAHKEVSLVGWGKFQLKESAERKGRNPQTGEEMTIPAKNHVKFSAGKPLVELFN